MQRQTTGIPYLLTDKRYIQQITRPRTGKKTQAGVQHLLYQLFIITLAPLPPTSQIPRGTVIYSLGVVAVFGHVQPQSPQLKEATADNTTDVLLHRQLIVEVDAKISYDFRWLDDVIIPTESVRSADDNLRRLARMHSTAPF